MLLRITSLALIVFAMSCTKKPPTKPLVGSVSFSVNGTNYSWDEQQSQNASNVNTYLLMYIYTPIPGTYFFYASNAASTWLIPGKEINLTFNTNTLNTNTPYTLTNTVAPGYPYPHEIVVFPTIAYDPAYVYNASAIGDFATVTITNLHDGRADGSFSAKLTRVSDASTINITNGTFKNVEINP